MTHLFWTLSWFLKEAFCCIKQFVVKMYTNLNDMFYFFVPFHVCMLKKEQFIM